MSKIDELKQEPIPEPQKGKAKQILNVVSNMMSKLVICPTKSIKDLFIEEVLTINPNPKKATEKAEEFLKIILEINNKDARIKLLKLFMGFGESQPYTSPVGQGFVELLQGTTFTFDDIFTGEIQNMKIELDSALSIFREQIKFKDTQHVTKDVVDKTMQSIIKNAKIYLNNKETPLADDDSIDNYRLLKDILYRESKLCGDSDMFEHLLNKCSHKVEIDDFRDYLTTKLKINPSEYVANFEDFYDMHVDTTQRGYISGYELSNLSEMKIDIQVSMLDFIKESLNGIIELDNCLNHELE